MPIIVSIPLKDAQAVLAYIRHNDLLDKNYLHLKTKTAIQYVVKKKFAGFDVKFTATKKPKNPSTKKKQSLKEILQEKLSASDLEKLKTSFDIVGTIAILEIDDDLRKKEKIIANALLESNANIKTVVRKDSSHEGIFRTQKMKHLAGVKTTKTQYVESSARMIVDVQDVYFSARISTERLRIAKQIKDSETILCMFSGAAPYPIVFAKNAKPKKIVGIEINPAGHELGLESVKLNKLSNIDLYCGDVHKLLPKVKAAYKTFDRITMPLPKSAEEFLPDALAVSKVGTIIHYYDFLHEDEFELAKEKIANACKLVNKKYEVLGIYTCGTQGVRTFRICVDFVIV